MKQDTQLHAIGFGEERTIFRRVSGLPPMLLNKITPLSFN